jgi:hypothetical protein
MTDSTQQPQADIQGSPKATAKGWSSPALRTLKNFLWMDKQVADARLKVYGAGKPGWEEFLLARAATNDVKTLGETGEGLGSAILLIRSAILLLVHAHLKRAGIEVKPEDTGHECWTRFVELPIAEEFTAELTTSEKALFTSVLGVQGEVFLATLVEEQRKIALGTLTNVAQRLAEPFEFDANRVQKVLVARWAKLAGVAVIVSLIIASLWNRFDNKTNLALHKHVTVVTTHPVWGKDPSQLVDGNKTEMGFHTIEAANQTATIDLGQAYRISRVVVYNRTDCCQERAVPLRIDVSEDGKDFKKVALRTEPFNPDWTAEFSRVKARYVRLTNLSPTYFHLTEVEVY